MRRDCWGRGFRPKRLRRRKGKVIVEDFATLPDYLAPGLDVVLVGINPSLPSVRSGHYFANPRNRFWRALNASGIVGAELSPELDRTLPEYGFGFTDLVKRASAQASDLKAGDFRKGCPLVQKKLLAYQPRIACFHGLTGYRAFLKYGEGCNAGAELGLQSRTIGETRLFVVPNPSPANAQYSVQVLTEWYRNLGRLRDELANGGG